MTFGLPKMIVLRTYRDYVNDTGQDVAVEAGPNGPENVRLCFSTSDQRLNRQLC